MRLATRRRHVFLLVLFLVLLVFGFSQARNKAPAETARTPGGNHRRPPIDQAILQHNLAHRKAPVKPVSNATLVVYVYYDGKMTATDGKIRKGWGTHYGFAHDKTTKKRPTQTNNLEFFLRHGLVSNVDYLFVMNSPTPKGLEIPVLDNIFVWEKENSCYDLGSFHLGVQHMAAKYKRTYSRYLLVNASVRGPFLPPHGRGCWTDHFLDHLSDEVKLVGTTWYCETEKRAPPHVQTMVIGMDSIGYDAALPALQCPATIHDAIFTGEIPLTGLIEQQGYKVHSLTTAYSADPEDCQDGDLNYANRYYGMSFHPYEVVFIKTNRGIDDKALAQYTEWHDKIITRQASSCQYHIPLRSLTAISRR